MRLDRSSLAPNTEEWRILDDGGELSFARVISGWQSDPEFRSFWHASLRDAPFSAYCWECRPVTAATVSRPFECVFVSSPLLARLPPDPGPFNEYFRPGCEVVKFESLGRDAVLVAPCPGAPGSNFSHLESFVASATMAQASVLWRAVGEAMAEHVGASPTWLSTAGLGVAWLHVRLDTRPKYYRHAPYARA